MVVMKYISSENEASGDARRHGGGVVGGGLQDGGRAGRLVAGGHGVRAARRRLHFLLLLHRRRHRRQAAIAVWAAVVWAEAVLHEWEGRGRDERREQLRARVRLPPRLGL